MERQSRSAAFLVLEEFQPNAMIRPMIARRPFLKTLTLATAGLASRSLVAGPKQDFPIGACDWSIKAKHELAAFDTGSKIGLEGLQVSFSDPGTQLDLRERKVRDQYYKRSDETGIQIASLGMGVLNQKPLSTNPDSIKWVDQAIDVIAKMKKERPDKAPSVCLLAFFGKGDINGKPDLMKSVIRKLKTVAKKAEDNGAVFGIESLLSADDHLKVIDGVGSSSIQVYYDSANSARMGYNIYDEVVQIGGERICEVHCKENGALLGQGKIDFPRWKKCLTKAGFKGWLIIEGGMPKNAEVVQAYQENFKLLDRVFRK
ncbi:MAG: xylose isomerase [Verrucomicrobiales bacterium]|nr:xylose isomerase [Verrucomicrobiales bacterium]|tara:strand:+ start:8623 stop:9570 length:948 start_codon:yes stop_codon:yes gene_type:complete